MIVPIIVYACLGLAMVFVAVATAMTYFVADRLPVFARLALAFAVAILTTVLGWSWVTRVDKTLERWGPTNHRVFD